MTAGSLAARIEQALRTDATRPFITWYDDATGERVELSVATTANWVAKTANLLRDTLDVQPGDQVGMALPRHWQTPVAQLATWLAGAGVVTVAPGAPLPAGCVVVFVPESALESIDVPRGADVVALSLRPMAGRLGRERSGVLDFAVEVPGHGDDFRVGPAADPVPAAVVDGHPLDAADLLGAVERSGLSAGQRALVRHEPWTADGLVATGLAPLLAGAGVVLCAGDAVVPPSRLEAERVSVTLG